MLTVSFQFEGKPHFKNISLTLKKVEKIAIYSKNSQASSTRYYIKFL